MPRSWYKGDLDTFRLTALALSLGAVACGSSGDSGGSADGGNQASAGSGGSVLACGDGTTRKGNQCVPSSTSADSGTQPETDAGVNHKSDAGAMDTTSLTCGPGTKSMDGKCVVDPASQVTCGDGTISTDGKCLVAPPPPKNIEGLTISQLSLRNRGELVADGGKIHQFYPIEFSIGLTYKGDAAKIPVVFALGAPPDLTKSDAEQKDLPFCLVGGFSIDHPGGSTPTESISSVTLQIPKGCLGKDETLRTVSPIVLIDPDQTLGAKNPDAVSLNLSFIKANDVPEMQACRSDPAADGAKGTCQLEASIDASPGLDFGIAELTAESSVVVVDKCAAGSDADRPVSYRCNSSIVRQFKIVRDGDNNPVLDANGNTQILLDDSGEPVQETYTENNVQKLRFVYGAADLDLDVTVMTYGAPDSQITSLADADKLKPTDDQKAVNNVLSDHGLQIQYAIRPSKSSSTSDWKPLYLHKPGEQAKAGEMSESGQDKAPFEETEMVPATPHYYSHGLYVENDCGERNLDTCDMNINPRTDIVSGAWADETDFIVRACLVPVDEAGAADASFDDNPDNNCREIPIRIVRHETTTVTNNASSYGFNYQWADGEGSQSTLRLAWGFHTWNKVDTSGATTDNEAAVTLGSDLVGSIDVLKGWAKGAAYVSLVGSYYDYGISTFGVKLWGDSKMVPEFHYDQDWSVSKSLSKSTRVFAGCVPVILSLSIGGTAGVTVSVDVIGVNAPLSAHEEAGTFLAGKTGGATRIGLAQLAVTPYGNMSVVASAAVDAVVVHVGIAGELSLLSMRVPLTGRMWWGMTSLSPINMRMGAWADMRLTFSVMSGRIYLFAENEVFDWCSKREKVGLIHITVKYPCSDWETFWDLTIASWSGWTWNQTLWTSPYVEYNLP
jgi:hypothetical protein